MTCEIEFHETGALRFHKPIMSSESPPVTVSQSLDGAQIFIEYDGKRYVVSVARVAEAVIQQIRCEPSPEDQ